ncbi:bifunctional phosphoribosylaminoimidazolecarboxamide formyltransferase/IMP cyclohydrolase, partial [candidate division KSB1 bacterium]|nr:bifunctional phosphoribosylaminoimidazolecarboxamide formyltransferase/IMP cyclohydrolase [candidate division KSB1 bacterium]
MLDKIKIKRALVSVYNKAELLPLARLLKELDVEILSTGGTAKFLQDNNIPVISVSDVTQFPEILGGRVKTLHPHIHGAILAKREDSEQMAQLKSLDMTAIDMVVVNLYPFEKTISRAEVTLAEALENIDIGGPCMIRAAAKNYPGVAVLTDPSQYADVIDELSANQGALSLQMRQRLSLAAFQRTSQYDHAIQGYLSQAEKEGTFPDILSLRLLKMQDLRYGENPHQPAAFYRDEKDRPFGEQLHGKELSFNNIMDIHSAMGLASEYSEPCVVIVKHNNPCGVALGSDIAEAYDKALQTDSVSAFGGIVAVNRPIQTELAKKLNELFLEVVVAPEFTAEALQILRQKKNVRLIRWPQVNITASDWDVKKVLGGYLFQ